MNVTLAPETSYGLFKKAAQNAVLPFRRLYFDTEPLRAGGWPRPSKQLSGVLGLANLMQVDLRLPEPVRMEREAQWLRDTGASSGKPTRQWTHLIQL